MSRNLKPEDLKGLLAALKNQLERLLPGDAIPLVILDTTGVAHRGLTQKLQSVSRLTITFATSMSMS